MKRILGMALAIVLASHASTTWGQQCNRSSSGRAGSISPGAYGSLNNPLSYGSYSNYGQGLAYAPSAGQLQAYYQRAQYQAMLSQRMDRLMQMEIANQVAAQRAALRNAQKAKKAAKKEAALSAAR